MSSQEPYHGWLIELIQEQAGYSFQCCWLEKSISVSDHQIYVTSEQALRGARLRADLETVRLSLSNFLQGKLQRLLLSPDERASLENSIAQIVDSATQLCCES